MIGVWYLHNVTRLTSFSFICNHYFQYIQYIYMNILNEENNIDRSTGQLQ